MVKLRKFKSSHPDHLNQGFMAISHEPFFCLCQLCVKNTNLPYVPAILSCRFADIPYSSIPTSYSTQVLSSRRSCSPCLCDPSRNSYPLQELQLLLVWHHTYASDYEWEHSYFRISKKILCYIPTN